MDSTGTAYYIYAFGSTAGLAFRLYGGGTTHASAWSYPSQFGCAMQFTAPRAAAGRQAHLT